MKLHHKSLSKSIQAIRMLLLLLPSVFSLEKSTNSDEPGTINILPYTAFFNKKAYHTPKVQELPKSFIAGFKPIEKYTQALKYLEDIEKKKKGRVRPYINDEMFERTVISVFYTKEYFLTLQRDWELGKKLHIYDVYLDNFITMVKMANIPHFAKHEGLYLSIRDINTILALYEIFSMDKYVRIPIHIKEKFKMDMTKRECFKENLRVLLQFNENANSEYLKILRDIRYKNRHVLMAEVPPRRIDSKSWIKWLLRREVNLDVFWYLFSTLCNTVKDNNLKKIVTYVKETSVLGKKGIQLFFSNKKAPNTDYVGLSYYLLYNNQLKVKNIEVVIQEDLEIPELQFSSVMEVFQLVRVVYMRSLGNFKRIQNNLSLVNIVLDIEKKRSERRMKPIMSGFVIYDYNSLNEFGKKQILAMNFTEVGFMTELYRDRVCVDKSHPCLFRLNHRSPNFLGKFSISVPNAANIETLVSPYDYVFEELNLEKLYNLSDLKISLPENELKEPYKDSELPLIAREKMNIKTVRLYGESTQQEAAYVNMFKKILKIQSVESIDITDVAIMNSEIVSALESKDNLVKKKVKLFAFTYFDPGFDKAENGGQDFIPTAVTLEKIFKALPNLQRMDVTIMNDKAEGKALLQDFLYLLKCKGTIYTEEQLRNIVNIKINSPLLYTSVHTCDDIVGIGLRRLLPAVREIFRAPLSCPNGNSSDIVKKVVIPEFMHSLDHVLRPNMCTPEAV
ncbi:hypothetical protein NEPAR06_0362 [Nematocida parisii]|uniref:Uncharacterized protein n=1 Tax=Nematocida parisii (strain ERTm3) TaxID=935791 RepID=I3EG83_NEMP3|nr:uncharacterized protein NEPG_01275 [Nematocida parisii ERTm1]EIJ88230.1 hypothetical protein NEQG_01674 [Nematocida parisii ERTm3]KAI5125362.1 hypothetical protein NEPAR03_0037 [Nematocida parisii]EIJ93703.1 hypothetical protein NEPG_01275 [Nematocida parisii ERTm1]KAI5125486.1 hypothetical protein NEPAR08_0037 [Nematocida parisii]KAI5140632.1 hypothetical protein NEPAR04_0373 [Nematocida parisii]|eukprot:XP_013059103.1 hypothetical protein NEPG_01275 [Nematocida parisii ERTm1]